MRVRPLPPPLQSLQSCEKNYFSGVIRSAEMPLLLQQQLMQTLVTGAPSLTVDNVDVTVKLNTPVGEDAGNM